MNGADRNSAGPASPAIRLRGLSLLVVLLCLVNLGYFCSLGDYFLSDDFTLLCAAETATSFSDVTGLTLDERPHFLRPVVSVSWWLGYSLFGLSPLPYHLVNTLFHLLNAWLLAWVVFGLTRHRLAAWLTGAAFAVYPIHPEAVTWLSGRVDVLAATGYLAALGFWVQFVKYGGRVRHLAGAALCFTIAILSKEMAATLPIAAAVVAFFVRDRAPVRRLVLGLGLLGLVLGVYLGGRFALFGGIGGYRTAEGKSLHQQLNPHTARKLVKAAVRQAAAPAIRDRHPSRFDPLRSLPLVAVGLAALITLISGGLRRLARHALLGISLFLVALLPLLGWAVLGDDGQSSRFLYLPSAFACTALGAAFLARPGGRPQIIALLGFGAVWVGVYLIGLRETNVAWHEASRSARTVVDTAIERARLRPTTRELVVTDLPDNHEGAYVFRNGFQQAMLMTHPRRMPVNVLPREMWDEARIAARKARAVDRLFLRWDATEKVWRTK